MWNPGQTVRVKMMGGTPFIRSRVRQYAEEWTQHANIRFAFVDPSEYAEIRIAFDPTGQSWSRLGRDALGTTFDFATMNFGWFTDDTPELEFSRVVLHEFGHALGLVHEHQSPVSGIQWDREKTYAFFEGQGWDRAKVDAQVFEKYKVSVTNYSQYDPTSIMHYWVPAELTLDGTGVAGSNVLSTTDKEYVGRWYPHPPTPQTATGLLRTGDDCDEIDFAVEYNVAAGTDVEFRLAAASGLKWWKAIEVPVGGSNYRMLQIQDGATASETIPLADIDVSRPQRFWKAKAFGVHTRLNFTWDVLRALPGGSRLSLLWKRDRC
jgi:hypothetical protein